MVSRVLKPGRLKAVAATLAFAGAAGAVYHPVAASPATIINGAVDDAYAIIWQLWWFRGSVTDLAGSPFFTPFVESPFGVGLTQMTILNHLLAWPITALGGPVASFNVMILFSFAASGAAMYLLAREVTGSAAASFFAGAAYAFSPYHTAFSASGGMDAAQVQYLPLVLLFLLRFRRTGSTADLTLVFAALVFTVFSFGYYAALAAVAVAVFFIFFYIVPLLAPSGGSGISGFSSLVYGAFAFAFIVFAWNTAPAVAFPVKAVAAACLPLGLAAAVRGGGGLAGRVRGLWGGMTRAQRGVAAAGGFGTALAVHALLVPVFTAAARPISESYLVPWFAYLVPPPSHPVLGPLVPGSLVPEADPLSGKMVHLGVALTALAVAGIFTGRRASGGAGTAERPARRFFAVLFVISLTLLIPPVVRVGDFTFYGPVYYFHMAVPPFVDIRRVVVLVLLASSVLAGTALADMLKRLPGPAGAALFAAALALLCVEFYPATDFRDLSRAPGAYGWLASVEDDAIVAEYPLTSIYDTRRYEAFYGQTIHGKRLVNPFAAVGHDPRPANRGLGEVIDRGGPANDLFANGVLASSALAGLGVDYVVVRTDKLSFAPDMEGKGLELAASFDDSLVYRVTAEPSKALVAFSGFSRSGYFRNYLSAEDGGFTVDNPYIQPAELWRPDGAWLSMGWNAEIRIRPGVSGSTTPGPRSFDLRLRAVSLAGPTHLTVTAEGGGSTRFAITGEPRDIVLRGLLVPEGREVSVRFEIPGDVALKRIEEAPAEGSSQVMAGAGIGDVRLVETEARRQRPGGPGQGRDALRFDGIYYTGEDRNI